MLILWMMKSQRATDNIICKRLHNWWLRTVEELERYVILKQILIKIIKFQLFSM